VYDFTEFPAAVVDCASAPQLCSIIAFTPDREAIASHAVDFDPSAPIPLPDVSVSPQTDLPDGGVVHVHATGFAAGERLLVQQCVADAPVLSTACNQNAGPTFQADGTGTLDTSFVVHRDLPASDGAFVLADGPDNCADAFGTCVIRVRSLDFPLAVADVPLGFDPTAVASPPGPTTPPVDPSVDSPPTRALAFTGAGAATVPAAALGFGLLLVGGALLLLTRRRAAV
jgi:hypothetical protein